MEQVAYICGLFENKRGTLFSYLQNFLDGIGVRSECVELYSENNQFGSYTFDREVLRIRKLIEESHPTVVIAHSLGAYAVMQVPATYPRILLDPSLAVSDVIFPHIKRDNKLRAYYDDGEYRIPLSRDFIESMRTMPTIRDLLKGVDGNKVYIFGAGHGGHKVAEQYHRFLPRSSYVFLPEADHNFLHAQDKQAILAILKQELDARSSP